MFRAKTLFIIGAGASVEVGLPVGADLLTQIVKLTHFGFQYGQQTLGDHDIVAALKIILNEGPEVEKLIAHLPAGRQLGTSAKQAISIDNVIDALEDPRVELVGKLGIAKAILMAEGSSLNFKLSERHPTALDVSKFSGTWYGSLTKLLTENIRKSEVGELFSNFEIINFNYDRCLEHYLPYSLAEYYGVPAETIKDIMQSLVVHRPYGMVGKLPWQKLPEPSVGFGESDARQLAEVSHQLRTFTERVEERDELKTMKASIAKADRIIFLGFAFHRQNVQLLAQKVLPHTEIVATALKISKSDKLVIEDELAKAFEFHGLGHRGRIELADATCNNFFNEYWRTLTAEKSDHEPTQFPSPLPRFEPFNPYR